jgi:hypothetical protein
MEGSVWKGLGGSHSVVCVRVLGREEEDGRVRFYSARQVCLRDSHL